MMAADSTSSKLQVKNVDTDQHNTEICPTQ